jgi:ABC-2 type transport system permease protein
MNKVILATMKRNHIVSQRAFPWSFFIARVLMGIYVAVFAYFTYYYMFNGKMDSRFLEYSNGVDYMSYAVLGAGLYILSISILMNVGRSLMLENVEGTLENFLLSPSSRMGYFFGVFMEQLGRSTLEFLTVILFSLLLGAKFLIAQPFEVILVIILTVLSLFCVGIFVATLMLYLRDTYITQNTLFIVMSLVCGVSFPIEYLPSPVQILSSVFPLSPALALFRQVMTGESLGSHLFDIFHIVLLGVLYCSLGLFWLKKVEKKLLENTFN